MTKSDGGDLFPPIPAKLMMDDDDDDDDGNFMLTMG